jgi:hypothetical protein
MSPSPPRIQRVLRSRPIVLGIAVAAAGLVMAATGGADRTPVDVAAWPVVSEARAADAPPSAPRAAAGAPSTPDAPKSPAPPGTGPDASGGEVDAEITIDERGMRVTRPGRDSPHVTVGGRDYDSFEAFVEQAPWIAGLVFMTTAFVFLVPLVVIILVVWYKMRRTRMMNETMLKLAERGLVPPGEAMQAISEGRPGPAVESGPVTGPLYEQARALRKRAAWSDLRKGVILGAIGFGLVIGSMFDDGSPNGLGLVLLFVGVGFVVLWYFEDRAAPGRDAGPQKPAGGA